MFVVLIAVAVAVLAVGLRVAVKRWAWVRWGGSEGSQRVEFRAFAAFCGFEVNVDRCSEFARPGEPGSVLREAVDVGASEAGDRLIDDLLGFEGVEVVTTGWLPNWLPRASPPNRRRSDPLYCWVDLLGRYSNPGSQLPQLPGVVLRLRSEGVLGGAPVRKQAPSRRTPHLTATEIAELVAAYAEGATNVELQRRFSVGAETVARHVGRAGVRRPVHRLDAAKVAKAAGLYERGWSLQRLGDEFGCAPNTVRSALLRVGVTLRTRAR